MKRVSLSAHRRLSVTLRLAPLLVAACGAQSNELVGETWNRERPSYNSDAGALSTEAGVSDPDSEMTQGDSGQPHFEDPGCPQIDEPPASIECDPLLGETECGVGFACSPYVDYPSGPCETEHFGTACRVAGPGLQGDSCIDDDCAAGFLCVATGQGTVCAQLCVSPGPNTCPVGFICGTVDLEGYGVCF